jgi:hypothetical protein
VTQQREEILLFGVALKGRALSLSIFFFNEDGHKALNYPLSHLGLSARTQDPGIEIEKFARS